MINSRPLGALSKDPNDLIPLSPGLFLNLEPLSCLPDHKMAIADTSPPGLLEKMAQKYSQTLIQRHKWNDPLLPIEYGTMIILKSELMPPLQWHIGRIIETHPGADGIIRVVTVRTKQGIFERPVVKLYPLPLFV